MGISEADRKDTIEIYSYFATRGHGHDESLKATITWVTTLSPAEVNRVVNDYITMEESS